jgi:CsoR family transcriptional regulator, copper-sensing transcriptional repressor
MITMMFWYGGGWAWWQAGLMWLAMIAFWALLIWAVYALVTGIARRPGQAASVDVQRQPGDARRILDERLARGEIDAEEYRRLRRLRKIEGQVRGLQKMIEADTWCPDVVTQVASATRALQEVAVGLLNDHIAHCVADAAASSPEDGDARLAEVAATIRQVIRL